MPSYLESLTLDLAAGVGLLKEGTRQRHGEFLTSKQNADGGFSGREGGSDLYYSGFALRSLAMLGELHGDVAERAGDFFRNRLGGQAVIIDFLSLLYGAMLLEAAAGVDVFAAAPPDWKRRVADELERFRREDGGYAKSHEGALSSTYYSFLVLLCLQLVDCPPAEPRRIVEFLLSRQRDDGGFVEMAPMKSSGTNPTAAAIGALRILEAVDDSVRDNAIDYLLNRQTDEGGLAANTRIPFADVLSSFTGLLTLRDLGAMHELDLPAVERFVRSLESDTGGFLAGNFDQGLDVEYTFYGLGAMALLAGQEPPGNSP